MKKQTLTWILRAIISLLFLISTLSKMDPLWSFEKQMVDLNICTWCTSHYLARFILALEFSIAVLILLPYFLKKLTIPITIGLLAAFCIHLSMQMIQFGANAGNCGCFGQWLPMTPLEAFIKNILTIGLLIWLYFLLNSEQTNNRKFWPLLMTYIASALLIFVFFPFAPCKQSEKEMITNNNTNQVDTADSVALNPADTAVSILPTSLLDSSKLKPNKIAKDTGKSNTINMGPKAVKSKFASFTSFGGTAANLDKDKKIVCMFAPGCDHCQAAAKELCAYSKKGQLPPVYILFMDEEAELVPEFFKIAGCTFPYQVLDIPTFWKTMGPDGGTPAVFYMWNGNIIKKWTGTEDNHFEVKELLKSLK